MMSLVRAVLRGGLSASAGTNEDLPVEALVEVESGRKVRQEKSIYTTNNDLKSKVTLKNGRVAK
jgi:hypothetical protein